MPKQKPRLPESPSPSSGVILVDGLVKETCRPIVRGRGRRTSTMTLRRRSFLRTTLGAAALPLPLSARRAAAAEGRPFSDERLAEVAAAPVLRIDGLEKPVKIASMELLRNRRNFL